MGVQIFKDWKGKPINKEKHGRNKAASLIYFLVVTTNIAFVSSMINIVTYLRNVMHMGVAAASTTTTNFIGVTCAFALFGGFLSDSYLTRFRTILIFGPVEFLGYGLLALQAHLPSLRPPECNASMQLKKCEPVRSYNAVILYIAIYTIALGEGCVRANHASFGGDQFDENDQTESRQKASFFNWFTFSISLGALTGLIFIVWIENHKGWDYGFALCALFVLLGIIVFTSGFPLYRNQQPQGSPLTRMLQVFVAAFRKRKLALPENEQDLQQVVKEEMMDGEILQHTKGFEFLDKASIPWGKTGKWSLCAVTQVEETKIVLRMLPIIISAILGYLPIPQLLTLTVQQGGTMNTKIGSINVSPATLLTIPTLFQMVMLVIYDRLFVPFARRITGYKNGITNLQRVGIGFMSIPLATCAAALIERKRKRVAEEHGLTDSGTGVPMSVMWLLLQFIGVAVNDVFSFTGLLEFFNGEASRGMKSMGTAIFWCVLGLSNLIGSFLIDIVNKATRHGGKMGWLEGDNLNKSYLDRFYWLVAAVGFVGFFNHLFWATRYVYRHPLHAPSS